MLYVFKLIKKWTLLRKLTDLKDNHKMSALRIAAWNDDFKYHTMRYSMYTKTILKLRKL